jgi:hypothetical protein
MGRAAGRTIREPEDLPDFFKGRDPDGKGIFPAGGLRGKGSFAKTGMKETGCNPWNGNVSRIFYFKETQNP